MGARPLQRFYPLKRGPKRRKIATFDTEGTGEPGKFVCGALVTPTDKYTFTDQREMLACLTSPQLRGYWLFAHNLEYDLAVLTSGDLRPFTCLFTDVKLLWAETKDQHGHKWRFCDSGNLFTAQTVASLGQMAGLPKLTLPPHLQNHVNEGQSLSNLPRQDRDAITDYCLRDAEIICQALEMLQDELISLGGRLHPTISKCSMDLFRRGYMLDPWAVPHPGINAMARDGYYGARTEPYQLGRVEGVSGYDINSLYPSIQRDLELPHPDYLSVYPGTSVTHSIIDKPGLSAVKLLVPDLEPPPLPQRLNHHLFFPIGELTGVWPHNELAYALTCGVELLDIQWSIVASQSFNPFTEFIDDLYKRRLIHASDGDIRAQVFKLLLNSAYGRYGINPENALTVLTSIPPDPDWDEYAGTEFRLINGFPYALVPIPSTRQPAYCNVPIAAYISAGARIRMHQEISHNLDRLIYTDTDSLFITGDLPTSTELGGMKETHKDVSLWVVAPKEYAIFSGEALIDVHVKGVPEAHRLLYLKTGVARFESPARIREGAKLGIAPATWVKRLKRKRYQVPKRSPVFPHSPGQACYQTRAWSFLELIDLLDHPSQSQFPEAVCPAL